MRTCRIDKYEMIIKKILNSTRREIGEKRFNIFIGISLGNKYFSKKNIKKYLVWAIGKTKSKVIVLIADKMQAINYEVRHKYSPERSLAVAKRKGDEVERSIIKILNSLPESDRNKVHIIRWKDIETNIDYLRGKRAVESFYKLNREFREDIINIVRDNINPSIISLSDNDYERLSRYPLLELPLFIEGIKYNGDIYNLVPYPGIGKIDLLAKDIQSLKRFATLRNKFRPNAKCVIVEAYVD